MACARQPGASLAPGAGSAPCLSRQISVGGLRVSLQAAVLPSRTDGLLVHS